MGLRLLDADRPAAEDDEMIGPRGDVEDRLVGEIGHPIEPLDRRRARRRAGGDDEAAGAGALLAGDELPRPAEARAGMGDGCAPPPPARPPTLRADPPPDPPDTAPHPPGNHSPS